MMTTKEKIIYIIKIVFADIWLFTIIIFLLLGLAVVYMMTGKAEQAEETAYGVTFSQLFAQQLDLDWRQAYLAILNELNVDKLRLVAYWPIIEPTKDKYSFADLDWQLEQAQKSEAEVILVVGRRVPRWPECHIPDWASSLSEEKQQEEILSLIREIVLRYKDSEVIKYWQVENEPFLKNFGICPELDVDFLDKEIALVQSLDSRPVILTTSGELSLWSSPAQRTNILGTTLYRTVYSSKINNHFTYPIAPVFYYKRANLIKKLFSVDKVFVVEMAAEPWNKKQIYESTLEEQFASMNVHIFRKNLEYMRKTGFDEFYFWGAEWWYYLKEKHNDTAMWQEVIKLWSENKQDENIN